MFALTPSQQIVMDKILAFLDDTRRQVFILKGYAGTGKTTMLVELVAYLEKENRTFQLMAPTGRAAKVLSEKIAARERDKDDEKTGARLGEDSENTEEESRGEKREYIATTIHKGIYNFQKIKEEKTSEGETEGIKYYFNLDIDRYPGLCIVDEASMIGNKNSENASLRFGSGALLNDLIAYAQINKGGKLIFVGDPMQLPPVGDRESWALNEAYFREKGIEVESVELTEVLRQSEGSLILKNAYALREAASNALHTTIRFETDEEEMIATDSLVPWLNENKEKLRTGEAVVISYSNRQVLVYNELVRARLFKGNEEGIQVGDRLMFCANNYAKNHVLLNGEFAEVVAVASGVEKQSAPIWINKKKEIVTLRFRNVRLLLDTGEEIECKIIDSLLDSEQGALGYKEQTALWINAKFRFEKYFAAKYPKGIATDKNDYEQEKTNFFQNDEYYNAVRAKYGYAITGHKSQGGEWKDVYVDFMYRHLLNADTMRWVYTVITRSSKRLVGAGMPYREQVSSLKIMPPLECKSGEGNLLEYVIAPKTTPFHNEEILPGVKARYEAIAKSLENTPYKIQRVENKDWQQWYFIETEEGVIQVKGKYNKSGLVTFFDTSSLTNILNDFSTLKFDLRYAPSCKVFELLYQKIISAAQEVGLEVVHVDEQIAKYKIVYQLLSKKSVVRLDVSFNKERHISYIQPLSTMGKEDEALINLIELIQN